MNKKKNVLTLTNLGGSLSFFYFSIVFRTVLLYTGIVQDTVGGMYEFSIQKRDPRNVYSQTHR